MSPGPERPGPGLFAAAAVVPRREDGQVLVGKRTPYERTYADYLVFPGGGMDATDVELPLLSGIEDETAERACALRELGEESGRWMVADGEGRAPDAATAARFAAGVERGAELGEVLAACSLALDDRRLVPLGRWHTLDGRPRQFAVRQFLLPLRDEQALILPAGDELCDVGWTDPAALRAGWGQGDVLLLPPIRHVVATLAAHPGADEERLVAALKRVPGAREPRLRDIVEGVAVQPFRTPTLPPATHTNTVLLGAGDFLIVDPATPFPEEQAAFDALMDMLAEAGRRPRAVALTHHHVDHVSDAARVAERYRLEVWAHAETAARVDVRVDRLLEDKERVCLPGPVEREVEVLFTPGHAPGHVCFLERTTGVLVAGDMVASIGSILIDPPEGHMGTYLESLGRLLGEPVRRVLPSHGPLLADGKRRLSEHVAHRRQRQEQVERALVAAAAAVTPRELVSGIYGADTPEALYPLAARSVLAALELLVEEGRAREANGAFSALAA